jgi:hypothetical protein
VIRDNDRYYFGRARPDDGMPFSADGIPTVDEIYDVTARCWGYGLIHRIRTVTAAPIDHRDYRTKPGPPDEPEYAPEPTHRTVSPNRPPPPNLPARGQVWWNRIVVSVETLMALARGLGPIPWTGIARCAEAVRILEEKGDWIEFAERLPDAVVLVEGKVVEWREAAPGGEDRAAPGAGEEPADTPRDPAGTA